MTDFAALYVYSQTEFVTASRVQSINGDVLAPSGNHITLPRGVYRYEQSASLEPVQASDPPSFDRARFTKGDFPDPPLRAQNELGVTRSDVENFLAIAGDRTAI